MPSISAGLLWEAGIVIYNLRIANQCAARPAPPGAAHPLREDMRRATIALLAALAGGVAAAAGPPASPVPLREGLTIVTAIQEPGRGDFESIKRIDRVTPDLVHLTYSAEQRTGKMQSARGVAREDLRTARQYRNFFTSNEDKSYAGWTAIGPSTAVMDDLAKTGKAEFAFQVTGGAVLVHGTLERVGPVKVPVIVNGTRVQLDAVLATGAFGDYRAEFYFLDDPEQPLTLHYDAWHVWPPALQARLEEMAKKNGRELPRLSEHRLDVVKIEYPAEAGAQGPDQPVENLEQKLEKAGRAEVYGIYFDFGSATIRPESEPVLTEIAGLLKKNPGWKLSIEGHTDNVGGDQYNLDLSNRRAAAVKTALVDRFHVAADRLTTVGYGASRPKESNDTLAGRARNRRVELVRQ